MKVNKEAGAQRSGAPTGEQLEKINALAKAELTAEQVYVFSLRLCDDQVDRDGEKFDTEALPELSRLFLGKTGILDHRWSAEGQVARIFETQVIREAGVSFIKAWAYIRRGGRGDEIIADIEAGIRKEVSVGCAMGRAVCSICGGDYGTCGHQKGHSYDGQVCCAILREPMDAYEFSFVAVPAQREAGVMKALGGGRVSLKDLAWEHGAQGEYRELAKLAELGRQYRRELEEAVVRLGLSLELGIEAPVLRSIVKTAGNEELTTLKRAWDEKLAQLLPPVYQLAADQEKESLDSGFMI